ncbi:cytochrome C biogenesis protein CcdA [Anoxybacillus sp. KU2-6(11)]|nr:cytochrome c biogenesis protein CcdA [Anoxybacillus sp. KU2-6(11)]KFZ41740.1 cytochrome C biogenesis protein CcdA [Anoxybacillus sp. KU2-6(11)]
MDIQLFVAFGAGVLSFISPCCLPLYPAFLSYITGISVSDLKSDYALLQKKKFVTYVIFFCSVFHLFLFAIGFGTSMLGRFFHIYQDLIRQIGAILMVFFGFVIIGIFKPTFLMTDRRLSFQQRPSGYIGSFLIGMAFAAGWTPCTGPILVSVIALAATNPSLGVVYMTAYSLGFALPFLLLSFFIGKMGWIRRHHVKLMKVGGYVMIGMGIVLFFDWMTKITIYMTNIFGGFTGF